MERAAAAEDTATRALDRAFRLYETLRASGRGMTLAELSVALATPKSSLLRLLRALVQRGHLLVHDGRYALGPEIFRFAAGIIAQRRFPGAIRPQMLALSQSTRETVYIASLDREAGMVTYADVIESPQLVRYAVAPGVRRPLYCSSAGRLLLAYESEAWRNAYLRRTKLRPLTDRTIVDAGALRAELEHIRREGIAVSIGEAVPDAAGIAAPIFGSDGQVIAALMVGGPADRIARDLPQLRPLLIEASNAASAVMGGTGA